MYDMYVTCTVSKTVIYMYVIKCIFIIIYVFIITYVLYLQDELFSYSL